MNSGGEKKERKRFLEVVTVLITAVMVVHNHGHGRDGGAWPLLDQFFFLFSLVTGVMNVHMIVTGVMVGRDHHWTNFFFFLFFCNGRDGCSTTWSRAWSVQDTHTRIFFEKLVLHFAPIYSHFIHYMTKTLTLQKQLKKGSKPILNITYMHIHIHIHKHDINKKKPHT